MDNCSQPGLLPVAGALKIMQGAMSSLTATEMVSLYESLDRVLAETVYSAINVPGHDNSAMDGYAMRYQDAALHKSLEVIGTSLAGHPFDGEIRTNECVRIMTGAVLPMHADTVIMQEQTRVQGNTIQLDVIPRFGENIRHAGEDIQAGALVLDKGKRINPVDIGLLASLGINQLSVFKRLRVAVFSTGDELTPIDQPLQPGNIYDSNRHTLVALLSRLNVEVIDIGLIADDPKKISEAFKSAIKQADVVISSGGVSVGEADYTKDVLESHGQITFWKVAIKPGKPFAFGSLNKSNTENQNIENPTIENNNQCYFFGLPGNPVSAVVTYHQLVLPMLRHLAGEAVEPPIMFDIATHNDLKKQPGRTDYQRGILKYSAGENYVLSTGKQGSGILTSIAQANCYIVIEQERGSVSRGEKVRVIPFDKFLS